MVVLGLFAGGVEKCARCIRVVGGCQVFGIQGGVITRVPFCSFAVEFVTLALEK